MNQSLTLTGSPGALAAALAAFASYDGAADAPHYTPVANVPEPTKVVEIPASAAPVYVEPTAAPTYTPVMPEVAAAAPTIPGEPEFDSSGLAWDGRIHSAQKGTTKDGKWRKKRDVADPYYNAVEAELRAAYGHPAPHVPVAAPTPVPVMTQPVAVPMPIPVMPVAPAMPVQGNAPMPMAQPSEPAPMVYGAVAVAPVASEPVPAMPVATAEPTMHDIMAHVGQNMPTGLITPDYLVALTAEINQQHGLAMQSFADMAANPGAIAYAWAAFQRDGKR